MKAISVFLLFLGTLLVLQGYYEQKLKTSCPPARTEVKVVPMSIYEEQMKPQESLTQFYKSMFESSTEWPPITTMKEAAILAGAAGADKNNS
jgi:hypothetical protein